jgi:membrane fusion protein (multidrug efflux system)
MASTATTVETLTKEPKEESKEASTGVRKKSRTRPYLILGAVVGIAIVGYTTFTLATRGKENTDDAQVDADVVMVSTRVAGTVLHVHVTDNQKVTKGQLLVEIDPADLQAKEKEAEAQLAQAKAQADAADAQVSIVGASAKGGLSAARAQLSGSASSVQTADAQIQSAKAALARAQAQATQADTDLARDQALFRDGAIPKAQIDSAQSTADATHAAVAQAQAELASAQEMKTTAVTHIAESAARVEQSAPVDAQLASARANAELAHARVDAAEAALAQAKLQLSYTRIEAAADGVLSRLAVREGQLVQMGQQVVSVVPEATYLVANFKETQVGAMRAGQRAEITVDAYPGRTFEGRVQSTSPGTGARFSLLPPDNASGNFVKVVQRVPVKITWADVPGDVKLAAGMSADVTVVTR